MRGRGFAGGTGFQGSPAPSSSEPGDPRSPREAVDRPSARGRWSRAQVLTAAAPSQGHRRPGAPSRSTEAGPPRWSWGCAVPPRGPQGLPHTGAADRRGRTTTQRVPARGPRGADLEAETRFGRRRRGRAGSQKEERWGHRDMGTVSPTGSGRGSHLEVTEDSPQTAVPAPRRTRPSVRSSHWERGGGQTHPDDPAGSGSCGLAPGHSEEGARCEGPAGRRQDGDAKRGGRLRIPRGGSAALMAQRPGAEPHRQPADGRRRTWRQRPPLRSFPLLVQSEADARPRPALAPSERSEPVSRGPGALADARQVGSSRGGGRGAGGASEVCLLFRRKRPFSHLIANLILLA